MATAKIPKTEKKAAPAFKPAKKGATITWTTGSRFGAHNHEGTVVAFVEAGATAEGKVPAAAKTFIDVAKASNRARYAVKMADGSFKFANVKSVVA